MACGEYDDVYHASPRNTELPGSLPHTPAVGGQSSKDANLEILIYESTKLQSEIDQLQGDLASLSARRKSNVCKFVHDALSFSDGSDANSTRPKCKVTTRPKETSTRSLTGDVGCKAA